MSFELHVSASKLEEAASHSRYGGKVDEEDASGAGEAKSDSGKVEEGVEAERLSSYGPKAVHEGMCFLDSRAVLVADTAKHRVGVHSLTGELLSSFGEEGSDEGQLCFPCGIAVAHSREDTLVYVADRDNHRVAVFRALPGGRRFEHAETIGGKGEEDGHFRAPQDVAIDGSGRLFVADRKNDRVQLFSSAADGHRHVCTFGGSGKAAGDFRNPHALAIDDSGQVYVLDQGNCRVQVFDADGSLRRMWAAAGSDDGQLSAPSSIAVSSLSAEVYVADSNNHRVVVFDLSGQFNRNIVGFPKPEDLRFPRALCLDERGHLMVADQLQLRLYRRMATDAHGELTGELDDDGVVADDDDESLLALDDDDDVDDDDGLGDTFSDLGDTPRRPLRRGDTGLSFNAEEGDYDFGSDEEDDDYAALSGVDETGDDDLFDDLDDDSAVAAADADDVADAVGKEKSLPDVIDDEGDGDDGDDDDFEGDDDDVDDFDDDDDDFEGDDDDDHHHHHRPDTAPSSTSAVVKTAGGGSVQFELDDALTSFRTLFDSMKADENGEVPCAKLQKRISSSHDVNFIIARAIVRRLAALGDDLIGWGELAAVIMAEKAAATAAEAAASKTAARKRSRSDSLASTAPSSASRKLSAATASRRQRRAEMVSLLGKAYSSSLQYNVPLKKVYIIDSGGEAVSAQTLMADRKVVTIFRRGRPTDGSDTTAAMTTGPAGASSKLAEDDDGTLTPAVSDPPRFMDRTDALLSVRVVFRTLLRATRAAQEAKRADEEEGEQGEHDDEEDGDAEGAGEEDARVEKEKEEGKSGGRLDDAASEEKEKKKTCEQVSTRALMIALAEDIDVTAALSSKLRAELLGALKRDEETEKTIGWEAVEQLFRDKEHALRLELGFAKPYLARLRRCYRAADSDNNGSAEVPALTDGLRSLDAVPEGVLDTLAGCGKAEISWCGLLQLMEKLKDGPETGQPAATRLAVPASAVPQPDCSCAVFCSLCEWRGRAGTTVCGECGEVEGAVMKRKRRCTRQLPAPRCARGKTVFLRRDDARQCTFKPRVDKKKQAKLLAEAADGVDFLTRTVQAERERRRKREYAVAEEDYNRQAVHKRCVTCKQEQALTHWAAGKMRCGYCGGQLAVPRSASGSSAASFMARVEESTLKKTARRSGGSASVSGSSSDRLSVSSSKTLRAALARKAKPILARVRALFVEKDADKDGALDADGVRAMFAALHERVSEDDVRRILRPGGGIVGSSAFLQWWRRHCPMCAAVGGRQSGALRNFVVDADCSLWSREFSEDERPLAPMNSLVCEQCYSAYLRATAGGPGSTLAM